MVWRASGAKNQRGRRKGVGGFFEGLAGTALNGVFTRIQMAGRVVQPEAVTGELFNQHELAAAIELALDDGRDGDTGFPTRLHGAIIG